MWLQLNKVKTKTGKPNNRMDIIEKIIADIVFGKIDINDHEHVNNHIDQEPDPDIDDDRSQGGMLLTSQQKNRQWNH
jgi:hypothetical protein